MPSHFPGTIRIQQNVFFGSAVFRRRQWIQHLQRIPASNRTRNDTGDLRPEPRRPVDDFAPNVVSALKSCCANWRVAK